MMRALTTLLALLLPLQEAPRGSALAARISQLLHTVVAGDDAEVERAQADARQIYADRGLLPIAEVGDEAAYAFVVLVCSKRSGTDRVDVLTKAKQAAARQALAPDAVAYCEARIRIDDQKARAESRPPTEPELRDEIQRLVVSDQQVRQPGGFDAAKALQVDREHRAALMAIFEKHGVPTYGMVGAEAASSFITMVQHQGLEFRRQVLPKLEANVEAGQADPADYATVYDRVAVNEGRLQRYGQNLECDSRNPTLHESPIEDEGGVNLRRAGVGLIRMDIYERLVVEFSPDFCRAPGAAK